MRKCAMTVVHCFYRCIACSFSTGTTMCPVPAKEVGQKGSAKLHRVPTAKGYHQQSGLNCTGLRTIIRKAGLP